MQIGLNRRTELALRALRVLDGSGRVSGAHLAERLGTTASYLPQVMGPLVRRGWVQSERGPNGGYLLTDEAVSISIRALIESMEGELPTGQCILADRPCPGDDRCALHESWQQAQSTLLEELDRIRVLPQRTTK